jgi:hypothetical protein
MFQGRTKKIAAVFLVIALIGAVLWYVLFSIIGKNVRAADALQAEVNDKLTLEDQNKGLQSFLSDNSEAVTTLTTRIIPTEGTVDFIDSIEALAASVKVGIIVNSVDLTKSATGGEIFENLTMQVTTEGDWQGVYTFMSMLQSLPYKISITNASLKNGIFSDGKANKSVWTGVFTFDVLKRK